MAIEFKREQFPGHTPEIWRGECKMLPGGFRPSQDFAVGTVLYRGTPLYVDFETMSAAVCKTARVLDGSTTTAVRVPKGHYFAVGDVVTKAGDGASSPSVKYVDTSNGGYDVVTLSAAYTGLKADDVLVEATPAAAAGGKATAKYTPNAVVGAVKHFDGHGLPTIDAAYEAVVLYPSLAQPVLDEWKQGICLKSNPNIVFVKQ